MSAPPLSPPPAPTADTRERLLNAARELFVADGVAGFSMRKLAAKAGLTAAAIYFHFADKDALLQELMAADCRAFREALAAAAGGVADPVERVREMGLAFVRFAAAQPEHFRLAFLENKGNLVRDPAAAWVGDPAHDAHAYLLAAVAAGVAAGRYRPEVADPHHLVHVLWSGVLGVATLYAAFGHDPHYRFRPAAETAAAVCDALLRSLTVRPGEL